MYRINLQHQGNNTVTSVNRLQCSFDRLIVMNSGDIYILKDRLTISIHRFRESIRYGRFTYFLIDSIFIIFFMHNGRTGYYLDCIAVENHIGVIRGLSYTGAYLHTGIRRTVCPIGVCFRAKITHRTYTVLCGFFFIRSIAMIRRSSGLIEILATPDHQHLIVIDTCRSPVIITISIFSIHELQARTISSCRNNLIFDNR